MKANLFIHILILFVFLLIACSPQLPRNEDEEILARTYRTYLYKSELIDVVPEGTSVKDSILLVKNYINKWIQQQLILRKAESNLSDEQKDFRIQLKNYRNSLITYQYETQLIQQNLDKTVTDDEIEEYYELNKQNFELKENIVKVYLIVLSIDSLLNNPVKSLLLSDDQDDHNELEEYCKHSAKEYFMEDQWLLFNKLLTYIPIELYNQQAFLEETPYFETQDSLYKYFVKINDYKIKESVSPLSFEKEIINNIIINKRKLELIKNMQQEVFENALKNNDFEIF